MSVYKRHFRVTTGALADEAKRIHDLTEQVRLAWIPLLTRLGAENYRYWADGTFAGFGFKGTPDQALYRVDRKHRDIWLPRKTTAEGKALLAEIAQLPKAESMQNALKVVGLYPGRPALVDGYRWFGPTMGGFPSKGIWFVEVPWRDEDPATLEKYRADREAGTRGDAELDHLLWSAPAEWEEIKHWQYLKEWEELSAKPEAA